MFIDCNRLHGLFISGISVSRLLKLLVSPVAHGRTLRQHVPPWNRSKRTGVIQSPGTTDISGLCNALCQSNTQQTDPASLCCALFRQCQPIPMGCTIQDSTPRVCYIPPIPSTAVTKFLQDNLSITARPALSKMRGVPLLPPTLYLTAKG